MTIITAISSCPPLPNPGMASVDLALYNLLRSVGLESSLKFVHLYTPEERNPNLSTEKKEQFKKWQKLPFKYECIRDQIDEVYKSDVIIFWGDFLHSRDYLYQVANIYTQIGIENELKSSVDRVLKYLYLSEASLDTLSKSLVFGGTLIFNRARDYLDTLYNTDLTRLFKNSSRVWVRDVYSSLRANRIIEKHDVNSLGVDCSLLIKNEDLRELEIGGFYRKSCDSKKSVGIFFGRNGEIPSKVVEFLRDLCRNLETEAEWLPWFAPFVLPNHLPNILRHFPELIHYNDYADMLLGDLLNRISSFDFIITDTYHVCLNSWRMGVPAICIGDTFSSDVYDVSLGWRNAWRDKRQTFYFMHDAMEFFIYKEELIDTQARKIRLEQLEQTLQRKEIAESIIENIRQASKYAESAFIESLRKLI